jgi:hypothetical protein
MTGTSPKQCAVSGCGRPRYARGWCVTHYRRWCRHRDPQAQRLVAARTAGAGGYWSVRRRLVAERGPATGYTCADCAAPARCWSYDGADPAERTDPARGVRYSTDLDRYRPRCRFCHQHAQRVNADPLATLRRAAPGLDPERAARLYEVGATCRGIGSLMGVSPDAVARALRALDVPLRSSGRHRQKDSPHSPHKEAPARKPSRPEHHTSTD